MKKLAAGVLKRVKKKVILETKFWRWHDLQFGFPPAMQMCHLLFMFIENMGTILDSTGMRRIWTATRASDHPVPYGIPSGDKTGQGTYKCRLWLCNGCLISVATFSGYTNPPVFRRTPYWGGLRNGDVRAPFCIILRTGCSIGTPISLSNNEI